MLRQATRQLSFTLVVGLWLSSAVSAWAACAPSACQMGCLAARGGDGCGGECCAAHRTPTLTTDCSCHAEVRCSEEPPAVSTTVARPEPTEALSHLSLLPSAQPHAPFFARFLPREPTHRPSRAPAPASHGLRAPPAA